MVREIDFSGTDVEGRQRDEDINMARANNMIERFKRCCPDGLGEYCLAVGISTIGRVAPKITAMGGDQIGPYESDGSPCVHVLYSADVPRDLMERAPKVFERMPVFYTENDSA